MAQRKAAVELLTTGPASLVEPIGGGRSARELASRVGRLLALAGGDLPRGRVLVSIDLPTQPAEPDALPSPALPGADDPLLAADEVPTTLPGDDPRLDAVLTAEDLVGAGEFAALCGTSRQTVANWTRAGRVLALKRGAGRNLYPRWQQERGRLLPGLDLVVAGLGQGWPSWRFLKLPQAELGGRTGLEALRAGALDPVRRAISGIEAGSFA